MMLFIDPRHHNLPYGTCANLKALPRPIDYPYSVTTGSETVGWTYHFLGSKRGAALVAEKLTAAGHGDVSTGLLFHVFNPNEPLTLSEPNARFLSEAEAVSKSADVDRPQVTQEEMALACPPVGEFGVGQGG